MYVSLRNKASRINLNNSEVLNSSADQSRVDSTSTKRFSRKQAAYQQSSRISRTPKGSQATLKATFPVYDSKPQPKKQTQTVSNFAQNNEFYLKLSQTPLKNKNYNPTPSTDRATQSSCVREKTECESMNLIFDSPNQKRNKYDDLHAELEIKSAEIMLLQDQNMRLKRDLGTKQSEFLKIKANAQKEYKKSIQSLRQQIESLKKQLLNKNQQIKNLKKAQTGIVRQLRSVKYEKTMLQKQLDDVYKRKLTKQLRDLMSYRQQSLQLQIQELREQIRRQKSDKEKQIQQRLDQMNQQKLEKVSVVKKLQIHSHVLNKKFMEIQEELKYKEHQFGKCLNNIQQNNEALALQLKKTRKENIKLQRINLLSKQNTRSLKSNFSPESNTLSLSLSSVNSRF